MISIIYLTFRQEPKFEWFIHSLINQCKKNNFERKNIQIVFVDSYLWNGNETERRNKLKTIVDGLFDYKHITPKPTVFQGPHKKTKIDYFCASNTRNTGVLYAKHDFIMYVDDLSILLDNWLANVIKGAKDGNYIIAGSYKKVNDMVVEKGKFINGVITGDDNRLAVYKDKYTGKNGYERIEINGGHLYGCSFGMPLKFYLAVNGQNEICDTIGGEDYELGIRLCKAGYKIYYIPSMVTYECDNMHYNNNLVKRMDTVVDKERYYYLLKKYYVDASKINHTQYNASHFIMDMALYNTKIYADNNGQSLKKLRDDVKAKIPLVRPDITEYFFNGEYITNL